MQKTLWKTQETLKELTKQLESFAKETGEFLKGSKDKSVKTIEKSRKTQVISAQ